MRNNITSTFALCLGLLGIMASCKEKTETGDGGWAEKNQHYIDSIANLATTGTNDWQRALCYYYADEYGKNTASNLDYVYYRIHRHGAGTKHVLFTDSVRIHYRGRRIDGTVFDQSYTSSEVRPEISVPALLPVSGSTIPGFTTALMQLVEGDSVTFVIPYTLGYGEGSGSIAANTTLIFDAKLQKVYKHGENTTFR